VLHGLEPFQRMPMTGSGIPDAIAMAVAHAFATLCRPGIRSSSTGHTGTREFSEPNTMIPSRTNAP
jgi:hypothetical protein